MSVNKYQEQSAAMSGADILIQALINEGIDTIFAYPGGGSIPLHQAMTRFRDKLRVILPRHEQGGGFAAQGYARSSGKVGVCMATSGPGATNLVTTIADAKLDSIPMIAVTGQVGTASIGSDAFQEAPFVEMCRSITKHHYLVTDVNDIARIVREALYIASTGRPGPVLIDIPKDIQIAQCVPDFKTPFDIPGYEGESRKPAESSLENIVEAMKAAKRPIIYAGGGIVASGAAAELRQLAEMTQIPVTTTMMGLSVFPRDHESALGMVGMHGTAYANHAVYEADLLLALGVRFDDRVTGKASAFAKEAKIVHVDIDPSEINKVKEADIAVVSDVKAVLTGLIGKLQGYKPAAEIGNWHKKLGQWKKDMPLSYDVKSPHILAQYAIEELWKAAKDRKTIIATGVGQHQMWTTQFYRFSEPRTWLSSAGLGTMGFGLPAAMGAKVACPDKLVIDIEGDGSLQMNIQELATCYCEKLPVKILLLNNQHLGMVMQWEDRFHKSNRANTYLGPIDDPEAFGKGTGIGPAVRYPNYAAIAKGYGWEALTVSEKSELPAAVRNMIDSPKPFLLDVTIPYQEHVLPMIPAGATVNEMIYL
ncbi:MAG: biosynthetic-type acetolactate synthase large subunit [Planctomycetaceae bacterium]|jgi:acetolactate synthase-1/2/3 large subunit|nr:biosynthetic-type acetolactate synthase large subunit [Planctomycetaceae bacterium]